MKKFTLSKENNDSALGFFEKKLQCSSSKDMFIKSCQVELIEQTIEFYGYIGELLRLIGFDRPSVTREGDVNCRMDAIIIDEKESIPIEIKSPRESIEINIKSIRQALENKIILLSRKFYKCEVDTTSLAIAYEYPSPRSDVYELVNDIKKSFGYNIGFVSTYDLLALVYDVQVNRKVFNREYFNRLFGKLEYEKTFH